MDYYDPVSSLTHAGMAVWAAFAGAVLVRLTRGHGRAARLAVGFYAATVVALYAASGLFHGLLAQLPGPREDAIRALAVFQKLDKSAIFLLIFGSNVPIMVYLLRGRWRAACLAGMGGAAAAGILSLWLLPDLPHPALVGVYVGMGLFGLAPAPWYVNAVGWRGLVWVGAFAGVYVAGAAADVFKWPIVVPGWVGYHEVLHIADMVATLIHLGFLVRFVLPRPPAGRGRALPAGPGGPILAFNLPARTLP